MRPSHGNAPSAAYAHYFGPAAPVYVPRGRLLQGTSDSRHRKKSRGSTVWNDLQIEQWQEDDHMRKTRAQHDQFWDQLNYNVDEYVKQDARHQQSPRKGSAELVRKLS